GYAGAASPSCRSRSPIVRARGKRRGRERGLTAPPRLSPPACSIHGRGSKRRRGEPKWSVRQIKSRLGIESFKDDLVGVLERLLRLCRRSYGPAHYLHAHRAPQPDNRIGQRGILAGYECEV